MAITVEYGKCDECGDNNVKTATQCRSFQAPLPWARRATKAPAAKKPASGAASNSSMASVPQESGGGISGGFYVQIAGGILFAVGVLMFLGNITRIYPTVPFGYIVGIVGAAIWRAGASMDE